MSRTALYQKYRSQNFNEVVGQEYIVQAIQNAIRENKVGHAYLFCGPRGTGKTTMARLLARAVNCSDHAHAPCGTCESCIEAMEGSHPDIIEINAANETHVEDIRDLIERAQLAPLLGHKKIYIIDEVHQLSTSASSALLKTLEEPPSHVIFILATTDPQKLLPTIISRCQRFDFSKVELPKIQNHLLYIAKEEGIQLEPKAAYKIAELANGGMRDALSILEQASAFEIGLIQESTINNIFGLASNELKITFLKAIFAKDLKQVIEMIRMSQQQGIDLKFLTKDLSTVLKDAIVYSYTKDESLCLVLNAQQANDLLQYNSTKVLLEMVKLLNEALMDYKNTASVVDYFEFTCMRLMSLSQCENMELFHVKQNSSSMIDQPIQEDRNMEPMERDIQLEVKKEIDNGVKEEVKEDIQQMDDPSEVIPEVNDIEEIPPQEMIDQEPLVEMDENAFQQPIDQADEKVESEQLVKNTDDSNKSNKKDSYKEGYQPIEINEDMVLGILAQCDKPTKFKDEEIYQSLVNGFEMNRYIGLLQQCTIGASGKDCVLLVTNNQGSANLINTLPFHQDFYYYLQEKGMDKMPYAISTTFFKECVASFVKRQNNLPTYQVVRYPEKVVPVQKTPEEKVLEVFGKDQVEIVE